MYVLYLGVMTNTRGGAKSWNRGGGYPNIQNWTFPRTPKKALFFRKSQRLREIHSYRYCIFKIHHNCTMSKQCLISLIMLACHMIYKEKTVHDHMWLLNEIRVTFDYYVGLTYRIWLLCDFTMWGGSDSIKWYLWPFMDS